MATLAEQCAIAFDRTLSWREAFWLPFLVSVSGLLR
jgi:hypothetical protein